ncbi:uncharacterized protein PG986_011188 [Apiospora aurea]|uniref:Uncharacterized protein n=1 Tax=Apiospora aurea TaxID=335848 RepID=A0ABR1Q4J9_9PEZI
MGEIEQFMLLYILAERNLTHLITILPAESCLDMGDERYICPLYAALAMGSRDTARVLLWSVAKDFPATHDTRLRFENIILRNEPLPAFQRDSNLRNEKELCNQLLRSNENLALTAADQIRRLGAASLLEPWDDVNSRYKQRQTLLSYAANYNSEGVAKLLIDTTETEGVLKLLLASKKANINSRDYNGRTPLFHAVIAEREGATGLLLASDEIEADARNKRGRTPLSYTASWGHTLEGIVKLLLASGTIDINSRDNEGRTCLSYAAENGKWRLMDLLLGSGLAEVDSRDSRGRTPLLGSRILAYSLLIEVYSGRL